MAKKEFTFKGKTVEELKNVSLKEFINLLSSRAKRSLERGFTDTQKILLKKIKAKNEGTYKKIIKTHCRNIIVIPNMLGLEIFVHNGKEFGKVMIIEEMLGHRLGEFVDTRKKIAHSAPGIGATKSSASASVK